MRYVCPQGCVLDLGMSKGHPGDCPEKGHGRFRYEKELRRSALLRPITAMGGQEIEEVNVPTWLAEARRLRAEGMSYGSIAADVGTTRNRVYYHLAACHRFKGTCEVCDKPFEASQQRRTCSRECWSKLPVSAATIARRRESMPDRKGKANPNYRHGHRVSQHERRLHREFNLAKKGEQVCRVCACERSSAMQAHHAVPRSLSTAGKYDLRNCLPLCAVCHSSWHKRALTIFRDIFTEEEWAFIETLVNPGWLDERYPDRSQPFREAGMERVAVA